MCKGLEALKVLVMSSTTIFNTKEQIAESIKIIENELKALEILRNKKVNLEYLKCCDTYEQYKTICSYWNEITKQEFDLVKEVLL